MKDGQESKTSVLVCMGRALADGGLLTDKTAMVLLPDDARRRVERIRSGAPVKGWRQALARGYLVRQSHVMAVRTLAIDDAVRRAGSPQLVIMGAGLDGRAWRMPELADVLAFEVDHPDTQRQKRSRIGALTRTAREVRFVPVDFSRDDLDAALDAAGHDATRPSTWLWEGVVMYLALSAIEATLSVIAHRSAAGSRLIILYHAPSPMLHLVRPVVRWLGEPLRSAFSADAMRDLLERHRFRVLSDTAVPDLAARMSPPLTMAVTKTVKPTKHLRLVVAERAMFV